MIVTLTGCKANTEVKPQSVFSSKFTLDYNSLQIKGELESLADGQINVTVSSPESLNGMKVNINDDKINVNYKGLKTSYTVSELPNSTFFLLAKSSLDKVLKGENMQYEKQDDGYASTVESEFGDIAVTLNKDFKITSITIEQQGFYLKMQS